MRSARALASERRVLWALMLFSFLAAVALLAGCSVAASGANGDTSGDGSLDGGGDGGGGSGDGEVPAPPGDSSGTADDGSGGTADGGDSGSGGDGTQSGQLTAGDVDDNLNFAFFTSWISSLLQAGENSELPAASLADRITLRIVDGAGAPVSNAKVTITAEGSQDIVVDSCAGTDGIFRFFPAADAAASVVAAEQATTYVAAVAGPDGGSAQSVTIDPAALPTALDVALVIDTTGSMSDELDYLTAEFRSIVRNVSDLHPEVDMQFGLVVYRDIGDAYVTRIYDFASSVDTMETQLGDQHADGGGDYEEAVEQGLRDGLGLSWRSGNVGRILFHVADAPPHNENLQATLDQAFNARTAGIRICTLAGSGVATTAEYMMRLCAVLTHGRYMFLTDDSGIGGTHAEPSVPCYIVTRLDSLMTRVIASELAGERVEPDADEIIRTVGNYTNGVCGDTQDGQTQ